MTAGSWDGRQAFPGKRIVARGRTSKEAEGGFKAYPRPDGLEVKTCRGAIRVDCHHNHPGLHLAVVLREDTGGVAVTEVAVAFLKASDYYRSERNTTATTDKFSFNGSRFASLLPPVEAAAG